MKPLILREAKELAKAVITPAKAKAWSAKADSLLWIEHNIFPEIGVQSSCNTVFGQALAEFIEDEFMKELGEISHEH